MLKGLKALFSSKIILNPFVLMGIFYAIFLNNTRDVSQIFDEFEKVEVYLLAAILALLYNIFIKKHLKLGGLSIDWEQTIVATIGSFCRLFISCFLALSFINFFSF